MTAAALSPYQVEAFNTATASENKIHDDAVARRFGFGGGLVPGVDVYAYMAHQPVARWGCAWLERGAAECRFQNRSTTAASRRSPRPRRRMAWISASTAMASSAPA